MVVLALTSIRLVADTSAPSSIYAFAVLVVLPTATAPLTETLASSDSLTARMRKSSSISEVTDILSPERSLASDPT